MKIPWEFCIFCLILIFCVGERIEFHKRQKPLLANAQNSCFFSERKNLYLLAYAYSAHDPIRSEKYLAQLHALTTRARCEDDLLKLRAAKLSERLFSLKEKGLHPIP